MTAGKNGKQRADRREREKKEVVGGERERKNESEKERKRGKKEKEVERKEIGVQEGDWGGKREESWTRAKNMEGGREGG